MKTRILCDLWGLEKCSTGMMANVYRILIKRLEETSLTITKIEDLSMIPGFSKAILRNIKKVEEDTRRLDIDSNDETEPEQESPTSGNGAKGQKRKLSNVCEQLGKKKKRRVPEKTNMSISSSSSSGSESLPDPGAHRVRCKVCARWIHHFEMRQHMRSHKK